ncbi:TraA family conjugative transfer protein [Neisseria weixii]|uniref:TraA family conjugative transfer protein n=1 Tax=Neisseria weixii TaxID=1853276 RepID=UPI003670FCFE
MKVKKFFLNQQQKVVAVFFAMGVLASNAMAAQTGQEFNGISTMLSGWSTGGLGLTLALAAFIIGLAVGMMKQTIMPAVVGIGVALAATLGPGIIQAMFTAVI